MFHYLRWHKSDCFCVFQNATSFRLVKFQSPPFLHLLPSWNDTYLIISKKLWKFLNFTRKTPITLFCFSQYPKFPKFFVSSGQDFHQQTSPKRQMLSKIKKTFFMATVFSIAYLVWKLTRQRPVVRMHVMIVIGQVCVVVVFVAGYPNRAAAEFFALQGVVIVSTEETVGPEGKLITRHKLSHACWTPKALQVINFRFRAHHEVILAERQAAFVALGAK